MWMGNLMFKYENESQTNETASTTNGTNENSSATANGDHANQQSSQTSSQDEHVDGNVPKINEPSPTANKDPKGKPKECFMVDFHSAQVLSPATDIAHLLLTSTTRDYRKEHWDEVIEHYYETFNVTLAEFGLVLRHLGTTYKDFLYEVKRALRGQFLCVAFIIPIGK